MGLHPARVARDLQKEIVAELKRKIDQFPRGLMKIFDLLEILQNSQNECAETKATWVLEQATAPDTEAGRLAILQAESDYIIAERMRKQVTQDLQFWVKRLRVSEAELKAFADAQTAFDEASNKLCELQSQLDDIENELEDQERSRRRNTTESVRLGSGKPSLTPEKSLAHRFTQAKKR